MANCPVCGKYVADDADAYLLSDNDPNCTLAHEDCYKSLGNDPEVIRKVLEDYMKS